MRRASRTIDSLAPSAPREWVVVPAYHKPQLAVELNRLSATGFDVFAVLTEGGNDGYDFTVIASRVGRLESPPSLDAVDPQASDPGTPTTRVKGGSS
jgi:hypothetical protein